jgi:hypothetical protein
MSSPTPPVTPSAPNRRGRGGGGRGLGRRGNRGDRPSTTNTPARTAFKGTTDAMHGNVFECQHERGDRLQYARTLEALEEYAKKSFKFYEDVAPLFAVTMSSPRVVLPEDLPDDPAPTRTQELLFTEQLKEYMRRTQELRSNLATLYAIIWGQSGPTKNCRCVRYTH